MDGDYQVDILNADIQMLYNGLGKLVRKIRQFIPKKEEYDSRKFKIQDKMSMQKIYSSLSKRDQDELVSRINRIYGPKFEAKE